MLARIKTKKGFYNSIVFALFKRGWNSSVIVFNQTYDAIELVKMWKPKRKVFIYNIEESDDWLKEKKVEGYPWVLENVSKRFFKPAINQNILDKCRALQATVESCDWFNINSKADVDGLMEVSIGFHDSYVKEIYIDSGKQYILFDTTWGCEILFELDGNVATNLFRDYGHIPIGDEYPLIFDSSMFCEDDLIYWVDDASIHSSLNLDKSKCHYFCAKKIKWKLIIP